MIAASQPVYRDENQFAGVVASTFFFSHISNFLGTLEIGKTGNAFVLERSGLLLSSSTKTPNSILRDGKREVVRGSESSNRLISYASKFIEGHFGGLNDIDRVTQLDFEINGEDHFLQITPFQDGRGLNWLIVVVMPASDFMMQINKNNQVTLLLMIGALVISVCVGVLTARMIVGPISRLNKTAMSLATGAWEHEPAHSPLSEVSGLAKSLDLMAKQLKAQFENAQELVSERTEQISKLEKEVQQRKLAEERAISGENTLAMSETAANLGHWKWDIKTQAVTWSKQCFVIFGRNPDTWVPTGDNFRNDMPPEDRDNLEAANACGFANGKPFSAEYRYFPGGFRDQTRWISVSCDFVKNENGKIEKMVGIVQDITERKELEERVVRAQKMEAVGQLTGGIAHDFNNILGIILGNLELIKLALPEGHPELDRVEKALKGSERGADITRKLLSFTRKDAHKTSLTSVNTFIEEIQELVSKSLTAMVQVETNLADDVWLVAIDTGDFEDVILNLSLNGRDAMPDGGTLVIETANKTLDESYVKRNPTAKVGDFVMISVSDTGVGMIDEVKEKAFEPFFTTKGLGEGTGLGLSMVYGFIQRSGGHLKIYSELGRGTTIRLYLPRAPEDEHGVAATNEIQTAPPPGSEAVLVVDDEAALLDVAASYLEALGYNVFKAIDGKQALKVLEAHPDIDIMFSDVIMPGSLDGYELASLVQEKYPSLKVLLSSGFIKRREESVNDDSNYLAEMSIPLLSKPYNQMELAQAIRHTLDDGY
jgi:PAS domain S-box-containing protein